jgi:hypothetical protein
MELSVARTSCAFAQLAQSVLRVMCSEQTTLCKTALVVNAGKAPRVSESGGDSVTRSHSS